MSLNPVHFLISSNNRIYFSHHITLLLFYILLLGCSSDESEDNPFSSDPFYKDVKTDSDTTLLFKFWSIYEVNFESRTAEIPNDFPNCDRNFFRFTNDGTYQDFIISDSGCIPNQQNLNWSFENGVITLSNSFDDSSEMVIVNLNAQEFIFRAKLDIDEDGEEDILQFLARPYTPDERKFYQNNIQLNEPVTNKIQLNWSQYDGIGSFERYEILLSTENCNIDTATVVASFTDIETISFEDGNPPQAAQLCYFLKVYTNDGLLFQSDAASISTDFIDVPGVELSVPEVSENSITLNWNSYEGLYFSHYELVVKNYIDGTGQGYQEELVAVINDIEQTSFTDSTPPLVKNPVYEIKTYNVFGKENLYNPQILTTVQEAIFKPNRVIDIIDILRFVSDPEEPIVYFFGAIESVYEKRLMRFNYDNLTIEAISDIELNFGQIKGMKLIESNGTKELFFLGNDRLLVFDAQTLQYKYDLKHNEIRSIDDFIYLNNNIFILINDENAYSIERDFANINLISSQPHFEASQNPNNYLHHVFKVSNNRVLIGSANETASISFNYDSQGNLSNKQIINIPITSTYTKQTVFNTSDNSIINFNENRIYSLNDFSIKSFEQPYFPMALISDETQLIGSNNDPEWQITEESPHKKSAIKYRITTTNLETIETEGYPHLYFENSSGDLFILSTFFKRNTPSTAFERSDFFIEKIN